MTLQVTNLHSQPIMLSDGTMLAAAGTDGSAKSVAELSDGDKRSLLRRGLISAVEQDLKVVDSAPAAAPRANIRTGGKETTREES